MSNLVELSFCIPTYNREKSVLRLVTDILSSNDQSIEVVVLDNGSTDNTLNVLEKIDDERLSLYSNGENKGALFNMVNVLNKGTGQFLVYSTDQDHIDISLIPDFKKMLAEQKNIAGGYCLFVSNVVDCYEVYSKGYEAIKKAAYLSRHPTGYFFNRELMQNTNFTERFSDYEFVDLFPLEFVFAEIFQSGNAIIYQNPIFTPETGDKVEKNKSSTTNGSIDNAFFSPKSRLKMAVSYSQHIETLDLSVVEKKRLMMDVFVKGLATATFGFQLIMSNQRLCIHYYMEQRSIGLLELLRIFKQFYSGYRLKTANLNAACSNRISFFVYFSLRSVVYIYERFKR